MAREAAEFDARYFDAQCDVAALVFGKPDEPDRVLSAFVRDLTGRGYRVVGLIQTRLGDGGAAVTVLPTGETIPLAPRDTCATSPASAPCDLAPAAARIDALIESGADLVIINRFGKAEAAGTGLADEITRALGSDIPVVVAVPEFRFPQWLAFCRGMAVKLPCQDRSLHDWWNAMIVGRQSRTHPNVCALLK